MHGSSAYDKPRILPCGETAVSVEFGNTIDRAVNERVHSLFRMLKSASPPGILDINPTYRSLLIQYDPWECSFEHLLLLIEEWSEIPTELESKPGVTVEIPVCYGGRFGPDLDAVADLHGITPEQVVEIHAAPVYHVCMIGFAPGFPYLGGLDERLFTPRLKEPREKVPEGSVGIADRQTGIYSIESPGGWRLIGRTPLKLFDLRRTDPFTLSPGSKVRFKPITGEAFGSTQAP